jgi:hypothetical protein
MSARRQPAAALSSLGDRNTGANRAGLMQVSPARSCRPSRDRERMCCFWLAQKAISSTARRSRSLGVGRYDAATYSLRQIIRMIVSVSPEPSGGARR